MEKMIEEDLNKYLIIVEFKYGILIQFGHLPHINI